MQDAARTNIIIQGVRPELDCGRYPVKRAVGDVLEARAEIFKEGHDVLAAVLKHREKGAAGWSETRMEVENAGLDLWRGGFDLTGNARYEYTIEAWFDEFETWRLETGKKVDAGQVVELELIEGREIVAKAAERSGDTSLTRTLEDFNAGAYDERLALLRSEGLRGLMARYPDRSRSSAYKTLEVVVDRVEARFAAWYEMFPRSQGIEPGRSATFREAEARLPEIVGMGFDVVYLTPIHPIGAAFRNGRNNALVAGPDDPGSPYGIGSTERGGDHKSLRAEREAVDGFRGRRPRKLAQAAALRTPIHAAHRGTRVCSPAKIPRPTCFSTG